MDISSQEIEAIVKQVLAGMGGAQTSAAPAAYTAAPGGAAGDRGVFENVDDAVEAAWKAPNGIIKVSSVFIFLI